MSATQTDSEFHFVPIHFKRCRGSTSLSGGTVPCANQCVVLLLAITPPSPSPAGFTVHGGGPVPCVNQFVVLLLAIAPPSPTQVGFRGVRAGGAAGGQTWPDVMRARTATGERRRERRTAAGTAIGGGSGANGGRNGDRRRANGGGIADGSGERRTAGTANGKLRQKSTRRAPGEPRRAQKRTRRGHDNTRGTLDSSKTRGNI